MTWLVFGVSCLLVLAGAVSIISGAPIIQLERGWAEVISGTVAVSSGGVVFALAGILMRLEALRDALAARPSLPAIPILPVAATATASPDPGPVEGVTTEASPMAEPTPAPATSRQDGRVDVLWKPVRSPATAILASEPSTPDSLRQHGFPDRVLSDPPPPSPFSPEPTVIVPAHATPAEAPVVSLAPAAPPRPDRDGGSIGWLERSLERDQDATADRVAGRVEQSPLAAPEADPDHRTDPRLDDEPAPTGQPSLPEPVAVSELEPTPDLVSEQHEGASVVGRYQAGSASYVMYSDGTIEVETESGETHRFGSMEELKSFIAQQEALP